MGKGRAPTSMEYNLISRRKDTVYKLTPMSERAKNYAEAYNVSIKEAAARIRYNDTHQK